jgi:predicted outer membrane protein
MHANAFEIEAARIAMRNAQNRAVYEFARRMFDDHTSMQSQMGTTWSPAQHNWLSDWQNTMRRQGERARNDAWRSTGNMTAEAGSFDNWMYLNADDWAKLNRLENTRGFAFDKLYTQMMVRDHAMLVQKFERHQEMSGNTGVTGWMSGNVETIRHHLDEARRLSYMYDDPFHFQRSWPWKH